MILTPKKILTLNDVLKYTKGTKNYTENKKINSIVTNSKEARKNDLFIAVSGSKSSGNEYLDEAKANGAYTLSDERDDADIKVADICSAVLDIARSYKNTFNGIKTVAVTGSVGKTTTKNILKDILSKFYKVHATHENYNNYLGVFHTVMTMGENTEILVAELGMNHTYEISSLSKAIEPDISIITNVGTAHIGNLGSREKIAEAKLEILDGMQNGYLIIPYGEPLLKTNKKAYTISLTDESANCCISAKEMTQLGITYNTKIDNEVIKNSYIDCYGKHILQSIGYAVYTLKLLGHTKDEIASVIKFYNYTKFREKFEKIGSLTVYDDTYSSSYEAAVANFEMLSSLPVPEKSAVIGDMLELGECTESLHRKIGQNVCKYGFKRLYLFGKYSSFVKDGATEAGMEEKNVFVNEDLEKPEVTAEQILNTVSKGELLFFKASNKVRARRIIDILKEKFK